MKATKKILKMPVLTELCKKMTKDPISLIYFMWSKLCKVK